MAGAPRLLKADLGPLSATSLTWLAHICSPGPVGARARGAAARAASAAALAPLGPHHGRRLRGRLRGARLRVTRDTALPEQSVDTLAAVACEGVWAPSRGVRRFGLRKRRVFHTHHTHWQVSACFVCDSLQSCTHLRGTRQPVHLRTRVPCLWRLSRWRPGRRTACKVAPAAQRPHSRRPCRLSVLLQLAAWSLLPPLPLPPVAARSLMQVQVSLGEWKRPDPPQECTARTKRPAARICCQPGTGPLPSGRRRTRRPCWRNRSVRRTVPTGAGTPDPPAACGWRCQGWQPAGNRHRSSHSLARRGRGAGSSSSTGPCAHTAGGVACTWAMSRCVRWRI